MHLFENTILHWKDKEYPNERILWIDPSCTNVVVVNIDDPNSLPYWRQYTEIEEAFSKGFVEKNINDPYGYLYALDEDSLSSAAIKVRETGWSKIKDIVAKEPDIYDNNARGRLIQDICNSNPKTYAANIYQYLKKYWKRGKKLNALLPDFEKCGGRTKSRLETATLTGAKRGRPSKIENETGRRTGINIIPEIAAIFEENINTYHLNPNKRLSLQRSFEYAKVDISNLYNSKDWKEKLASQKITQPLSIPTFGQFSYWYYNKRKDNLIDYVIKKEGERKFSRKHKSAIDNATMKAWGPLSVLELDSTLMDIYVVNGNNRSRVIKKRPILYLVIDVFTRMIVGFYVGLENASWNSMRKALFNTMTSKVEFCKLYDIEITEKDWPAQHVPRVVFSDNGSEMLSQNSNNLKRLGIHIANARPYTPEYKPFVEKSFDKFNKEIIHSVAGSVRKDSNERGAPNPQEYAEITLYELTQIIIYTILKFNKQVINTYPSAAHMVADGLVCSPINLWNWGYKNRNALLREELPNTIKFALLFKKEVSITDKGISFGNDMYYSCPSIIDAGLTLRNIGRKTPKVNVFYDPEDMRTIYLERKGFKELEPCTLTKYGKKYNYYNLFEIEDVGIVNALNTHGYQEKVEPELIEYDKKVLGILKNAKQATQRAKKQPPVIPIPPARPIQQEKQLPQNENKPVNTTLPKKGFLSPKDRYRQSIEEISTEIASKEKK